MELVQTTDYPWKGEVSIEVDPGAPRSFGIAIRAPDRRTSALYRPEPPCRGITSIAVNGKPVEPPLERGYAVITREWRVGDRISLVLPLPVERVKAVDAVAAVRGRVAIRRGPLIYNIESADGPIDGFLEPSSSLTPEWRPDLLGGVVVIRGAFAGGSPLTAVPNYARLNRGGRSIVWIRDR